MGNEVKKGQGVFIYLVFIVVHLFSLRRTPTSAEVVRNPLHSVVVHG
jgi:hypothetical protein